MRILISGASVAGPALACWLSRYDMDVTVVEVAPSLRTGGHAVDFRGDTHLTVLDRTGVLDELRELRTAGSPIRFVDAAGRTTLELPASFAGGDLEVHREDLSRVLYEHSAPAARYLFGDTVTGITDTPGGVEVTFQHAAAETFDLVIGADGIHSTVRRLVFGDESQFATFHGYQVANWQMPNVLGVGPGSVGLNAPGRFVSIAGDPRDESKAGAFVLFRSGTPVGRPAGTRKAAIDRACAGMGWEVPRILATLPAAELGYFDAITSVKVPAWSRGRVALVGDAAWGATLGGMGTGVAVVGAYVLAAALADCRSSSWGVAFARYESTMRDYATRCQAGGGRTGRFLAPKSRLGLTLRNRLMSRPSVMAWMVREGQRISAEVRLPDVVAAR